MTIGKYTLRNNMILAPLAGVSDYPFRTLCREYGCELAYSEMVSSEGLVRGSEKTSGYLYRGVEEWGDHQVMGFQIFGSEPEVMAEAAEIVAQKGADIVDINMGCPVKKVVKTMAGSALLKDIPLIGRIAKAVRKRITIPLTVKIRAGWGPEVNAVEVAKVLEESGVDALTLHARTRNQAFSGKADWSLIRKVKENVKIPVIGNGDVTSIEDYRRMIRETGCDAVMVGRGAMGRPWIFRLDGDEHYIPPLEEIKTTMLRHYSLSIEHYGEGKAMREMRKHLSWYTRGIQGGSGFRKRINGMTSLEDILNEIEVFFTLEKEKAEVSLA